MIIEVSETGFWNYNNSNHDESIYLDEKLCDFLIDFIEENKIEVFFDFGCSTGYYLSYLEQRLKNVKLVGVEPQVSERKNRHFEKILSFDLAQPFNLGIKGSIMCLEVIEHIPENLESIVIDNIVNHCENFLFISWARPGQGGRGHINEKSLSYVIGVFEEKGFNYLEKESLTARNIVSLPWLKNNFCIFEKKMVESL